MSETATPDMDAYIGAMEELASLGQVDFRADVQAGTELGSAQIPDSNSQVKWKKQSSRQNMGGVAMPERIPLWNLRTGRMSMVPPTIAMSRRSKGTKAFPPEVFTFRDPGFAQREPIEEGCEVCNRSRAEYGQGPRPFYDLYQLEMHKLALHPTRYAMDERRREAAERNESRQEMKELIAGLIEGLKPLIQSGQMSMAQAEEEVREAIGIGEFVCPTCGKEAKSQLGLNSHMRSHANE